jgi:hypothetical protein
VTFRVAPNWHESGYPGMSENGGVEEHVVIGRFRTVNAILEQAVASRPARKEDLGCGDYVVVTTENSVYSIQVLDDATYLVRGGWFDRQKLSPVTLTVSGCTWGGSVIKRDILAACGLHIEFGNRVLTSRVRDVLVIRCADGKHQGLRPIHSPELFASCYGPKAEAVSAA